MLRIGANPIIWSNDDMPEIGGDTPLETCLAEAKSIGIEGMELGNKFPRVASELKPIMARHGLDLVGGWYSTFLANRTAEEEFAGARAHIDLLKAFGCSVFIVAECTRTVHGTRSEPLSTRPRLDAAEWVRLTNGMTAFAKMLATEGLTLVYHHHMGTVIETGDEIDRLMAETGPEVKLLLDTGHATWAGVDPVTMARRYRDRIGHFHAKDVRHEVRKRAAAENMSFLDAVLEGVYTVPGDGGVDYVAVLKELPHYQGWVVLEAEQDPAKANPLTYARMGVENLKKFIKAAGR